MNVRRCYVCARRLSIESWMNYIKSGGEELAGGEDDIETPDDVEDEDRLYLGRNPRKFLDSSMNLR